MIDGFPSGRREWRWVVCLVMVALSLRLLYLPSQPLIYSDGVEYATLGEELANGHGLPRSLFPPGYPLAIAAGLHLGVSDAEAAGRAVSLMSGVLLIGLLVLVGRQLYGPMAGLAAGFLGAVYPPFIRKSTEVLSESLYMAVWFGAVAALLAGMRKSRPWYLGIAGLLTGFAYITRPEGAALAAVGAAAIIMQGWRLAWPRRRVLAGVLLFTLGTALPAVPYLVHLKHETGSWSLSGKTAFNLHLAEMVAAGDLEAQEAFQFGLTPSGEVRNVTFNQPTGAYLRENLGQVAVRYLKNLYEEYWALSRSLFSFLLIVVIGVGLTAPPWNKRRLWREAFCLGLLLPPLVVLPVFPVIDRYLIPSAGVFLLWGGRGLQQVNCWVKASAPSGWHWPIQVLAVVIVASIQVLPLLASPLLGSAEVPPVEWRAAGLWLRSHFPPGTRVLARRQEIAYYAGHQGLPIPYASLTEVVEYAKRHGATVLAVDERFTVPLRPQLRSLVSGPAPASFVLRHVEGTTEGRRVFLYEVRQ